MKKTLLIVSTLTILLFSCTQDRPINTYLIVDFTQTVDGNPLEKNSLEYTNAVGQNYSVQNLWYIISDITLHSDNGDNIIKDYHFINIENPSTLSFSINNLADGNYTSISYTLGLDSTKNSSYKYVNEDFHTTMAWPEMMGGGYHYMILEGNFNNDFTLYNTHTGGTMGNDFSFTHTDVISLITDKHTTDASININMEINNWYTNPNTINLTTDGIMGNMDMQMQLKQNGVDVFSTITD
jgi:hypothetical protein